MSDANLIVIRKTQDLLGKHVKKPQLSEKLLKKPPFRFLHDVIKVVIQETGYLDDLYTEDELNFENVKDKEAKIAFLQKLIDAVKVSSTEPIKVRPSKIVAGLEPERTNELLQAIGKAVDARKRPSSNQVEPPLVTPEAAPVKKVTLEAKSNSVSTGKPPSKVNATKKTSASPNAPSVTKAVGKSSRTVDSKEKSGKDGSKIPKTRSVPKEEAKRTKEKKLDANIIETPTAVEHNLHLESNGLDRSLTFEKDERTDNHPLENHNGHLQPNVTLTLGQSNEPEVIKAEPELDSTEKLSQIPNANGSEPMDSKAAPVLPRTVSSELIDVIDQEAEIRRRERSSRKHRKSAGQENSEQVATTTKTEVDTQPEIPSSAKTTSTRKRSSATVKSSASKSTVREEFEQPLQIVASTDEPQAQVPLVIRPRTSLRPPSVRPASARPGAPRRRDRNVEIILQPDDAAQQMAGIQVKIDKFPTVDLDDDGDNLIVIEDPSVSSALNKGTTEDVSRDNDGVMVDDQQQGHLVQQILQTQKEFSKPDDTDTRDDAQKDFLMKRQRQSSAKQMDTLRDSLQTLTRSVNPLGKLMDFLQEDIDSMEMELAAWRRAYQTTMVDLKRELSLNETAVQPLKNQLAQIEVTIGEYVELTHTSRLNILQNEEKIFKMLSEI